MPPGPLQIVSRVGAGVLGGWTFVWGFVTFGIGALLVAGMPYEDAQTLVYLLAFLVYLAVFCWAFAARRLARVWVVLVGAGALMTALGWWLARVSA